MCNKQDISYQHLIHLTPSSCFCYVFLAVISLRFLRENLISIKQTFPLPIFLHVGVEFSSSHMPGRKLKVKTEKHSKGFLTSVASRTHRASEEAGGSTVLFHLKIKSEDGGKKRDGLLFYLTSVWKLNKIKLANENSLKSFYLVFFLLQISCQSGSHSSFSLAPSFFPWTGDLKSAWCRVNSRLFSQCDWGCPRPAIVRTYLEQEIHWLIRGYFCISCFSDYNRTPETYLDWSLSMTHKSPQSVLNTG